jgi:YD repeat-containing protein
MKKAGLILLFFATFLSATGQGILMDLPYFPSHTAKPIKVIRTYSVDTLTGARMLKHTEHYDRHGYCADTAYRNVYDDLGRLVLHETYQRVSSSANPMPRRELMSRCSIEYAPDGVVQHVKRESFGKYHEGVSEYHLYSHKVHPRFGLTEYVYVIDWGREYRDTLRYLCEYDSAGRMLHEYCNDEGDGYRDRKLFYDALGRIVASRTYYYESWDTLDYNYDANGGLVSQTGKKYDLDMEADVTITFRSDGTRKERREHWKNYDDPTSTETSDEYYRYDEHDVLIYEKTPMGIIEYEIEYWE